MHRIITMACRSGRLWLMFVTLIFYCLPLSAQFVPGPYYYSDAGVMGTVSSAFQSAAQQRAYSDNRQLQMQSSMARSGAWQNINRSMQVEAASRTGPVPDSGQAARDWMYQHAPPHRTASRPMTLPPTRYSSPPPGIQTSSADLVPAAGESISKSAPKEIMLWPTILKDSIFDADRAKVEAPFRRYYAGGKSLTIEDYQAIIKAVEKMKATLKGMAPQLVEAEYLAVEKYLDDLIADAQKRIQAREGT